LTNSKIDFTKPLQTRSGLKVRILSTAFEFEQPEGEYLITAEVETRGYMTYDIDGKYYSGDNEEFYLDLQNIPEETFEQKVERFKKSEFYVSDKIYRNRNNKDIHEVVVWGDLSGFNVYEGFEEAIQMTEFK